MQTKQELIEWISNIEKDLINQEYILIDSLNYPEIDESIRALRTYFFQFESNLNHVRNHLTNCLRASPNEESLTELAN